MPTIALPFGIHGGGTAFAHHFGILGVQQLQLLDPHHFKAGAVICLPDDDIPARALTVGKPGIPIKGSIAASGDAGWVFGPGQLAFASAQGWAQLSGRALHTSAMRQFSTADPATDVGVAEWIVEAPVGTTFEVEFCHDRAGRVTVPVTLV